MTGPAQQTVDDGAARAQQMVVEADTGARSPMGLTGRVMAAVALIWSLFQLWYASPLPFAVNAFVFNDTEARAIHLALALFLAFTAYPAFAKAPRGYVPWYDWILAIAGLVCAGYLFVFYRDLAARSGIPTQLDLTVGAIGLVVLLEATRRALGPPLMVVGLVFLAYTFLGPYMPEVIQHRGSSIGRMVQHQWITTEGVFGVAVGVSTSFVFLFVLFGSLLEKAGAGNYMMQVSFALLGHLRGGPAKVAVVSSALNGVISGSSISNVVSGGIFTIPMMKRTGLGGVKAGAIEASSSINGQIMPPVMGAAAFLMVEYVGIPYSEIIRHAFLPAAISYVALLYIVHLEALKLGMKAIPKAPRPVRDTLLGWATGLTSIIVLSGVIYYGIGWTRDVFGPAATWIILTTCAVGYVGLIWYAARFPDLELDDPNAPVLNLPETWPTVRTGIHYLIPIVVLLWCLMVEMYSPGLSAFYATLSMIGILLTQRPLIALFRGQPIGPAAVQGWLDLMDGLILGARNMIGVAVATGTAGIIVGTVTLTGLGFMMTEFVEMISGGNVFLMLVFTAVISLVLGMGVPTTANYIIIATLMAPVIVELGAQGGMIIPLIAVHLFVFYFGIMADITPPVGLAAYAAAAISRADPIQTGLQGAFYSLRTALLPFLFIYNPQLLLVDVHGWFEAALVITGALVAMCAFSAATLGFLYIRTKVWEIVVLLLASFILMNPLFFMDLAYPRWQELPAGRLGEVMGDVPDKGRVAVRVEGLSIEGEDVNRTLSLRLGPPAPVEERLQAAGLRVMRSGDQYRIVQVQLGSQANKLGLEQGWTIGSVLVPNPERPSEYWLYIPAAALLGMVVLAQLSRRRRLSPALA
ncbi:MAG TPA: TRAP transporter permease [Azospirillaceae bacterium]|nr:TRAP transporter permease [Azospirillaceae bacterium]